jgi:uncharacterized damage-inducible protein DinB
MQALIKNIRDEVILRICDESIERIKKCLNLLSDEEIQYNSNDNTNSVNNLILHLEGNVRQWLIAPLNHSAYQRNRPNEFARNNIKSREELIEILVRLDQDVREACDELTVSYLLAIHNIQGFKETGYSICAHVVEHFSYHTGQITLITKQLQDRDLAYYGAYNLNIQNQ